MKTIYETQARAVWTEKPREIVVKPALNHFPEGGKMVRFNSRLLTEAEQGARLEHCQVCDKNTGGLCSLCSTCGGRSVRHKVRLSTEFCPLNKWGKLPH